MCDIGGLILSPSHLLAFFICRNPRLIKSWVFCVFSWKTPFFEQCIYSNLFGIIISLSKKIQQNGKHTH